MSPPHNGGYSCSVEIMSSNKNGNGLLMGNIGGVPPTDVVIVGAGNSAVDVALDTYRKGAKSVTMIIREKQIGENIKYWVRPDIINRIENKEINVFYESEIKEIKEKSIVINTPEETKEIKNDFVLAMTGYQPNYEILEKWNLL